MDKQLITLGAKIELARRRFFFYAQLKNPDFAKLAEAFGGFGVRVSRQQCVSIGLCGKIGTLADKLRVVCQLGKAFV